MFKKTIAKFLTGISLLVILILAAGSASKAQSTTLNQDETEHPELQEGLHPNPEPVTMILFGTGLLGVGVAARRRLRKSDDSAKKLK